MLQRFEDFSPYHHLFISMGLGLLIGLQREWAESPVAGIRSFSLMSLLGTVVAMMSEKLGYWFIGVGLLGAMGITFIVRLTLSSHHKLHKGLVTETSLILMFCIGVMVRTGPTLVAASIAVIIAFILQVKIELHTLVAKFNKNEIRSIMQFLAISLVIFPVVPSTSFGPNNVLNFHNIWIMVIFITGIGLIGDIIYKFKGEHKGILWAGILGGIISSTATTFSYSKRVRYSENLITHNALIILIAWSTLYIRVFVELFFVAPGLDLTKPLITMFLISSIVIIWFWRTKNSEVSDNKITYNPTSLKTAMVFAFFYSFIIYAFTFLKNKTDTSALSALAFMTGILDVDAVTLSTGRLFQKGLLTQKEGQLNCFLAITANITFKGILSMIFGGKNLFQFIFYPWLISLLFAVGIVLW
jgi:uncharacterized membrane protein (DUF4010 family)